MKARLPEWLAKDPQFAPEDDDSNAAASTRELGTLIGPQVGYLRSGLQSAELERADGADGAQPNRQDSHDPEDTARALARGRLLLKIADLEGQFVDIQLRLRDARAELAELQEDD